MYPQVDFPPDRGNLKLSTMQISFPSLFELSYSAKQDGVVSPELSKAVKQFAKRQRRIKRNRLGQQRSWLLVALPPCPDSDATKKAHWAREELSKIHKSIPFSGYKRLVTHVVNHATFAQFLSQYGTIRFAAEEGLELLLLPAAGILGLRSPPTRLKRYLEHANFACHWDWGVHGDLYEDRQAGPNSSILNVDDPVHAETISILQKRFGYGEGNAIAIVDSGVCNKARECKGRVVKRLKISLDSNKQYICLDQDPSEGVINDHGTKMCSIAAGERIGIASKAKIVSIALPTRPDGQYDQIALFIALEIFLSPSGPSIDGLHIRDFVSTILIANGFLNAEKLGERFDKTVATIFDALHNRYEVCTVAAIGNLREKIAFPANFQLVYAVGALSKDGSRYRSSGYGPDSTANMMPDGHVLGEEVCCEGKEGKRALASGTSVSAATMAGVFTILSSAKRSPVDRWAAVRAATTITRDGNGECKVIDLKKIV